MLNFRPTGTRDDELMIGVIFDPCCWSGWFSDISSRLERSGEGSNWNLSFGRRGVVVGFGRVEVGDMLGIVLCFSTGWISRYGIVEEDTTAPEIGV